MHPSTKWAKPAVSFCLSSIPESNSDVLPAVSFSSFHLVYPSDPTFTSPPTPAFFSSSLYLPDVFLIHFLPTWSILPVYETSPQMREATSYPMSGLRVTVIAACSEPFPFNEIQEAKELHMSLSNLSKNMWIGDDCKKKE